MKFGQLIEHPREKFFFKNYAENEAGKLVPNGLELSIQQKLA